ncbi:RNA helicase [Coprinopsis cinerea AmutBmut pab1-1]|nr:RNA helicase [Coprinopsis cinerea AmutBmut pab1-1]
MSTKNRGKSIDALLENLRDNPADNASASDDVLGRVYDYLIKDVSAKPGDLHWFCDKASRTTVAAASFLLRLFGFDGPLVEEWKKHFHRCLSSCAFCVESLECIKISARSTYFGAYTKEILDTFFQKFEAWELTRVLADLETRGFSTAPISRNQGRTLAEVPPPLLYRILANWTVFTDSNVQAILHAFVPDSAVPDWPSNHCPPGLIISMSDDSQKLREWACRQLPSLELAIMSLEKFTPSYVKAFRALTAAIQSQSNPASPISTVQLSSDPIILWSAFSTVLRLVPADWILSNRNQNLDLRHLVTSHLHDTGPHLINVLKSLFFLFKRLGKNFWTGEAHDFPQVCFDSMKDNQAFLELFHGKDRARILPGISEFLYTLHGTGAYGEVLAKAVDLLCRELQHERFADARPPIMAAGVRLLTSVIERSGKDKEARYDDDLRNTLDIHGLALVGVAYGRSHTSNDWAETRKSARHLFNLIFGRDSTRILSTVDRVCDIMNGVLPQSEGPSIPAPAICSSLWKEVHSAIQARDDTAIANVVLASAQTSHLSVLTKTSYHKIERVEAHGQGTIAGAEAIDSINAALAGTRSGFLDAISRFTNSSLSTTAMNLLAKPEVGRAVISLLLSPMPDCQTAAQSIIGLAFDVDVRMDCFRAMFSNLPIITFEGLTDFLTTFQEHANKVPEACTLSTSLVRCFNDVLEVLCSSPDGLLLSKTFLRPGDPQGPASRLLSFWKLLTTCITTIFKHTPVWSSFYKAKEMTVWMRDALILGRDIVGQWRLVESAINSDSAKPSKGLSHAGKEIVACFKAMLPQFFKWLRLTDEELLYQSLAIIRKLLQVLQETDEKPDNTTLERLQRFVASARNDKEQKKSRLDPASLMELGEALYQFDAHSDGDDDGDEIEIISHVKPPKKEKVDKRAVKPVVKEEKKVEVPAHVQQQRLLNKQLSSSKGKQSTFDSRQKQLNFKSLKDDEAKIKAASKLPKFKKIAQPTASTSKPGPKPEAASSTKTSNPPQSSEAEESSDDDDPGAALAALTAGPQLPKSPKIRKEQRRTIQMMDASTAPNPKAERIEQAKKDRQKALRLRPDISNLHKIILSWDYKHSGPYPPSGNWDPDILQQVPEEFRDYAQYHRIFEPLLLLECWAQILGTKKEVPPSYLFTVASKQYVSDWIDMDFSATDPIPNDWDLSDVDIVLLESPDGEKTVMGKAVTFRKGQMGAVATIRCYGQLTDPGMTISTPWKISKLYSLSTINREYGALLSLPHIESQRDQIFHAKAARMPDIDPAEVEKAMSTYKINEPQATAIIGAMASTGFVLIQGPPGTGKTSTICALVARFMSRRAIPITAPGSKEVPAKPKILICAPSNAAIDEIAQRLKAKYCDGDPVKKLSIVRMGAQGSIGSAVKGVSLDSLVQDKIQEETGNQGFPTEELNRQISMLKMEMESLKHARDEKLKEMTNLQNNYARHNALDQETQAMGRKRQALAAELNKLRDKLKSDGRSMEALRRKARFEIIRDADVICSTLSGSGHEALLDQTFEMVIIDEAAQAVELSSLIPLKYESKRCIMVGDPQQLPPTVISQQAASKKYDQSLFQRFFKKSPKAVHLLSIQYRMHPEISRFPSKAFYNDRIQDGPNMKELTARPWHAEPLLGIYKIFNVNGNAEEGPQNSLKNRAEVEVATALYRRLSTQFREFGLERKIGIVSPYRAQIKELERSFFQAFGQSVLDEIDFNTVDGFQGQEKDIIILSCVRGGPGVKSIGFMADVRRLNVAITRAKSALFILGNVPTLERSESIWKQAIADARERNLIVNVDSKTFTQPSAMTSVPVMKALKTPSRKKPRLSGPDNLPSQSQNLPAGLATPKALKNSMKKGFNPPPTAASLPNKPAQPVASASGSSSSPRPKLKRPAEDDGPNGLPPKPRNGPGPGNGPRPPPPKRAKTGMSMFIPKKKKKP